MGVGSKFFRDLEACNFVAAAVDAMKYSQECCAATDDCSLTDVTLALGGVVGVIVRGIGSVSA